jgi:hypothetical protein
MTPFYIGISSQDDDKYKRAYFKHNRSNCWNIIVKENSYEVEIVFEHKDFCFIKEKEKEFINMYGRIDLGTGSLTNKTSGGQGRTGALFSDSEKEKRRNCPKGKEHHRFGVSISEEQKRIVSLKMKGRKRPDISALLKGRKTAPEYLRFGDKNPFYNKKHTEESKIKISEASKKWYSENISPMKGTKNIKLKIYHENTKKEDKYWYGRSLSESHKENIRASNIGVKRTKETCEKNKQAQILRFKTSKHPRCKIVLNLESGVFYESAKEASDVFGYKKTTLVCMLNGSRLNRTNLIYV